MAKRQSMLFRLAQTDGNAYDLVCMDIMMPEMHGKAAVREIRALEESERYAMHMCSSPSIPCNW